MVLVIATVNISQLEAAFNTDLGDQQNPLQTEEFILQNTNDAVTHVETLLADFRNDRVTQHPY
jgi:hypothetical protein